jgi:hypothetical protein
MLDEQMIGCALSKGDYLCCRKKNIYFPSPLFEFFYFFCLFLFLKSLKKNKRMLHYKGGMSVATRKLVPRAWNTLILRERRHVQDKDIRGKFLHGSRCQVAKASSDARLAYKECLKGSVESNMEPTLGQRCKDDTHNAIKHDTVRLLLWMFYMSPEKVSAIVFLRLESLKKCKRRLQGVPFFEFV